MNEKKKRTGMYLNEFDYIGIEYKEINKKLNDVIFKNLNNETDKNNDKRGTAYGCSRFN